MGGTEEILHLLDKGERAEALRLYGYMLEETGGPGPADAEDAVVVINRRLDVWEQIGVFVTEVDVRPENARSWKLLGLAYARGGVYVTPLLRLAECAFEAAAVREDDQAVRGNIDEKIGLVRAAAAGDEGSLVNLIGSEGVLSAPTDYLPAEVPVPALFVRAGIISEATVPVDENTIAIELRGG